MRLSELVTDNHRTEVINRFRNAGYKPAGEGIDSMVFKKDGTHVAKIIFPQDPEQMSKALRVFMEFYVFCKQNPSTHLPKFSELNEVEVDGEVFTQVIMEKLDPIPNGSVEEAMVWLLSDAAANNRSWDTALDGAFDYATWSDYGGNASPDDILMSVQNLSHREIQSYAELYKLMKFLYKTGKAKQMGWDLHTDNVMERKNGTLVIIDPWMMD